MFFLGNKGKKKNFRRACQHFSIIGENQMYKGNRVVIKSKEERQQIISDVHQGIGNNCKVKAMASHRGRDSTYQKCSERFFWHNMLGDVAEFVK